ncbi:hypothetical protein Taro_055499, partial [Colocasia esculenta]|nr:hypothetical protein [Colocasia esculenta]
LIGKRVRLVDIDMQHVADGILISTEIERKSWAAKWALSTVRLWSIHDAAQFRLHVDYMHEHC